MHRREFLFRSAGGLTLAVTMPSTLIARVNHPEDQALISADAVLSIDPGGKVRFASPYTEMGQGSPTAASQIIADALDTNLDRLLVIHPEGTQAQKDEGFRNRFNGGGSGGSQSMTTAWPALQDIGATARTLLIAAAARVWDVDPARCETRQDQVICGDQSLPYGDLVKVAATLPTPKQLNYRDPAIFRYVGKGRARADLPQILTGQAPFAMDARMEGMVYAGLERCPACSGVPTVLNREQVLAIPGVLDLFALNSKEKTAVAKPAVVVVGKDTWAVMKGRKALKIDWHDGPDTYSNEDAFWQGLTEQLDQGNPNATETVGDFDAVDIGKLTTVSREYRTPHQNQAMMEPMAMVAHRQDDGFKIILSTQYPGGARDKIAELTGLEQDRIEVENRIMGGSFGRRFVPDCLTETVLIAERLRQPVKVMWTREDDTRHGQYRNASLTRIDAHLDDDGRIRRWHHRTVQTHPEDPAKVKSLAYGMSDTPYRFEAAKFEIHGIKGDVHLGPMRSPPHPLKFFALSSYIDELAHRQGRDPIDLHIELIGAPRDLKLTDWLIKHGHVDNTGRHVELARIIRKLSGWDTPAPKGHGRGFSSGFIFGTHVAMVVEVAWRDARIHIEKASCAVHCGRVINPDIARQQVEGGLIYGLSSAMGEAITTEGGRVKQGNFDSYPLLRFAQAPKIEVVFVDSDERPTGLGEPPTPPTYAALANAVFAASGKRIREIPLSRHINFA